mgnify:CR=1 FL=1
MNDYKIPAKDRWKNRYSYAYKKEVIESIENGKLSQNQASKIYGVHRKTISGWLKKYGNFDYQYTIKQKMSKTPEQRILELEQQVKILEKQKNRAEYLAERADKKVILFDMMIDIAEKEFNIPIRKKQEPK